MIEGYIFDLDGTLLNTLESLAASFNRSLASLGYPVHAVDDYRYFIGDGQRKCVERALPPGDVTEANVQAVMRAQQADYSDSWQDLAAPYDGIEELLAELSHRGLALAVLSNKDHPFAVRCVEHFFPGIRFGAIQGYTPDIPHKPDPKGALAIAARLGLAPRHIAFVGDTATDMRTATACGMPGIGVLWGFRDAAELNLAGAAHIIGHPSELLSVTRPGGH